MTARLPRSTPACAPQPARPGRWVRAAGVALAVALAAALSAGCAPLPRPVDPARACATPEADADWPSATAAALDFDPDALCAALQGAAASAQNLHGVLVERHGRLVAELYRDGPDRPLHARWTPFPGVTAFGPQVRHDLRSASKSVIGLLVGIEVARGRMAPIDTPLLGLSPAWADLRNPERDRITVRHLLTMTDGLAWREWQRGPLRSDETVLKFTADPGRHVLDRAQDAPAGTRFNYSGGDTALLAELLQRATGTPLAELARVHLFEPLDITDWHWATDLRGRPQAYAGLQLRPRDLLKLGRMVLDRGRWKGRQVVPADWIDASLRTAVATDVPLFGLGGGPVGYGLHWWTGERVAAGRTLHWAAAVGNGGQRLVVVPALDLAVVVTGGAYGEAGIQREVSSLIDQLVGAARPP